MKTLKMTTAEVSLHAGVPASDAKRAAKRSEPSPRCSLRFANRFASLERLHAGYAEVVERSVTNNSLSQDYSHPVDHTRHTTQYMYVVRHADRFAQHPLKICIVLADVRSCWTVV